MIAKRTQKATGCILNFRDYGESDRIVTILTDEAGKLKGIAKGARRSQKRFANAIEPFSVSSILFSRRKPEGLCLIEDCHVTNHYPKIREDLGKTLYASYFIDLVDLFSVEGAENRLLFFHLRNFLDLLESGPLSESILRLFELRLLCISGYEPALELCIACKTPLDRLKELSFIFEDGGIRCRECRPGAPQGVTLSPGTAMTLIAGKTMALEKIRRLVFSEQSLRESRMLLVPWIRHILGNEPKSLRVLQEVTRLTVR